MAGYDIDFHTELIDPELYDPKLDNLDPEILEIILEKNPILYENLGLEKRSNRKLAKIAVKESIYNMTIVPIELKEDPTFIMEIIDITHCPIYSYLHESLKDEEILCKCVSRPDCSEGCCRNIFDSLSSNQITVGLCKTFLKFNNADTPNLYGGPNFEPIIEHVFELSDELIMFGLPYKTTNLHHFSKQKQKSRKIIKMCVKFNGLNLKDAAPKFKNNFNICSHAVFNDPFAFEFVSDRLKDNRFLMKLALKNGMTLQFFKDMYKDNQYYVDMACHQNPLALLYASDRLKTKEALLLLCNYNFKNNKYKENFDGKLYNLLPPDLNEDLDILKIVLKYDTNNTLDNIPFNLRYTREFIMLSGELENPEDILLIDDIKLILAILKRKKSYYYKEIFNKFKKNYEFTTGIINIYGNSISECKIFKSIYEEVIFLLMKKFSTDYVFNIAFTKDIIKYLGNMYSTISKVAIIFEYLFSEL